MKTTDFKQCLWKTKWWKTLTDKTKKKLKENLLFGKKDLVNLKD